MTVKVTLPSGETVTGKLDRLTISACRCVTSLASTDPFFAKATHRKWRSLTRFGPTSNYSRNIKIPTSIT